MRVKAYIYFKGEFQLKCIGRTGKNGAFHFRNGQLRKACLETLRKTFAYECTGGTLTIPDANRNPVDEVVKRDGYITCYHRVRPEKENKKKFILTYKK